MFHIVFNADENYIKYTAVLINSIVKNTDKNKKFKDFFNNENSATGGGQLFNLNYDNLSEEEKTEGYVFHILSDFISNTSQAKLKALQNELNTHYPCEIQIHLINNDIFKDFATWGENKNHTTYYRLMLGSLLPKKLKTCLYLDVDMLCVGDIRKCFSIDLKDKVLAAVCELDVKNITLTSRHAHLSDINLKQPYFNCGFLLVNLDLYRVLNIEEKAFFIAKNYKLIYMDQDALNAVIEANFLKLNDTYNLSFNTFRNKNFAPHFNENAVLIYHYTPKKPWLDVVNYAYFQLYFGKILTFLGFSYQRYTLAKIISLWWDMALNTPVFHKKLNKKQVAINAMFKTFKKGLKKFFK